MQKENQKKARKPPKRATLNDLKELQEEQKKAFQESEERQLQYLEKQRKEEREYEIKEREKDRELLISVAKILSQGNSNIQKITLKDSFLMLEFP